MRLVILTLSIVEPYYFNYAIRLAFCPNLRKLMLNKCLNFKAEAVFYAVKKLTYFSNTPKVRIKEIEKYDIRHIWI